MAETFDSRADILQHILEVRTCIDTFLTEMLRRGRVHDASKFDPAEKPAFDEAIPLLRGVPYGSPRISPACWSVLHRLSTITTAAIAITQSTMAHKAYQASTCWIWSRSCCGSIGSSEAQPAGCDKACLQRRAIRHSGSTRCHPCKHPCPLASGNIRISRSRTLPNDFVHHGRAATRHRRPCR